MKNKIVELKKEMNNFRWDNLSLEHENKTLKAELERKNNQLNSMSDDVIYQFATTSNDPFESGSFRDLV